MCESSETARETTANLLQYIILQKQERMLGSNA